jgi:hypothetical protein
LSILSTYIVGIIEAATAGVLCVCVCVKSKFFSGLQNTLAGNREMTVIYEPKVKFLSVYMEKEVLERVLSLPFRFCCAGVLWVVLGHNCVRKYLRVVISNVGDISFWSELRWPQSLMGKLFRD